MLRKVIQSFIRNKKLGTRVGDTSCQEEQSSTKHMSEDDLTIDSSIAAVTDNVWISSNESVVEPNLQALASVRMAFRRRAVGEEELHSMLTGDVIIYVTPFPLSHTM